MILSGGLGSSAYVRDKLQQQLIAYPHLNAMRVSVVPCHDPQLVVVRGLLLDHQQRMDTGNVPVLVARIARSSYGIIVREMYSPATHFDEEVVQDQWDSKKKWAINQIQWVIKKVSKHDESLFIYSLLLSPIKGRRDRPKHSSCKVV